MAVVGPSGAGKSTLARVILGTWRINNGKVRLDGVDVHLWDKDQLGQYLGYLPQDVELFQGSLSDNIARFGQANSMLLEDAISIAQLGPIIKGLPSGLQTDVGDLGGILSGGQQQRVGLARAVYGNPKLVVLDEPNASMDTEGEKALRAAVAELKKRQAIVVLITHRRDMLDLADLILVLREGQVQGFGPRDQVLAAMQKAAEEARQRVLN
jgi:ABC-type protease/lipase transport system fused ATPase/permease subunit